MKILIKMVSVVAFSLMFINAAYANKFFIQSEYQFGDETLVSTTGSEKLKAGSGLGLGFGYQFDLDESTSAIRVSYSFISNTLDASDGSADWDHDALEAMYIRKFDNKYFGVGLALHQNPTYKLVLDGIGSGKTNYDNASGLVFQFGIVPNDRLEYGFKYTSLTYDSSGSSRDGNSLGMFVNYSF